MKTVKCVLLLLLCSTIQPVFADGLLRFNLVHHYLELHGENERAGSEDLRIFNFGAGSTPAGIDLSVGGGKKNSHYLYGRIRYIGEQNIIAPTPFDSETASGNGEGGDDAELTLFKDFMAFTVNYDKTALYENVEFILGGHFGYATVTVENANTTGGGFSADVSGFLVGYQAGFNWHVGNNFALHFMIDRPYYFAANKVGVRDIFGGTEGGDTALVLVGNFNTRFGVQYTF